MTLNARDPRQLSSVDSSPEVVEDDLEQMNFREFSDYLRQFPATFKNGINGNISIVDYASLGIKKTFTWVGDNMTRVVISGNLPSSVTQTIMTLRYSPSDELVQTTFS